MRIERNELCENAWHVIGVEGITAKGGCQRICLWWILVSFPACFLSRRRKWAELKLSIYAAAAAGEKVLSRASHALCDSKQPAPFAKNSIEDSDGQLRKPQESTHTPCVLWDNFKAMTIM